MKLRNKTLLVTISTMVLVLMILWIVTGTVLMSGFSKVENDSATRDVQRVQDAIYEMANNLSIKVVDWSKWDDTYQFINDSNSAYIESNLNDAALEDLKLDIMLFLNNKHKVIFSRIYNKESKSGSVLPSKIANILANDSLLSTHSSTTSEISGIYLLAGKPLLVVSKPIITSEGRGPIRGTLIFAKYFDNDEINRLQQITHIAIVTDIFENKNNPDFDKIKSIISRSDSIQIKPLNDKIIAGYSFIRGVDKKPVLLIQIKLPRDVYRQGINTKLYLILSIIIAGILLCIVIVILLERIVLFRISKLNQDVNTITEKQDHSLRVTIKGKDELASFSSSVNNMLCALQAKEILIEERNKEIHLLMNSVPTGLLSINEKFFINPIYSKSIEQILGQTDLAGKHFLDALNFDSNDETGKVDLINFLEIMQQELVAEKDIVELNPFKEYQLYTLSGMKWLRIHYFLIDRGKGLSKHILVTIENITDEKALAERASKSEKENMQLKALVEDPILFKDFLTEMKHIHQHANASFVSLNPDKPSLPIINDIFRDVHTIKGAAGSFGLTTVIEIAGILEEKLGRLRENGIIDSEIIILIKDSLSQLSAAIMEVMEVAKKIFGDDFNENNDIYLRISLEKLCHEFAALDSFLKNELILDQDYKQIRKKIEHQFMSLRSIPAKRGIAKALKIIPGVLRKLKKNIQIDIIGGDVSIDCEIAKELNTPLIHLIRNSIDHGIEPEDIRQAAGKSEQGHVSISIANIPDFIIVEVSDDGCGLDPELLKNTAIKKGLLTELEAERLTYQEALSLILKPGFTTAETVTDISGCGVGMDSVAVSIRENLFGDLSIESQKGIGTTFRIKVPHCSRFIP